MAQLLLEKKNIEARAVRLARKRGHTPGAFVPFGYVSSAAACTACGGQVLALASGEVSAPRLCRDCTDAGPEA
jgi:hypothetical protein